MKKEGAQSEIKKKYERRILSPLISNYKSNMIKKTENKKEKRIEPWIKVNKMKVKLNKKLPSFIGFNFQPSKNFLNSQEIKKNRLVNKFLNNNNINQPQQNMFQIPQNAQYFPHLFPFFPVIPPLKKSNSVKNDQILIDKETLEREKQHAIILNELKENIKELRFQNQKMNSFKDEFNNKYDSFREFVRHFRYRAGERIVGNHP